MPKRGIITAPTGASAAMKALADAVPVTDTLPSIVADMLALDDQEKIVIFNFALGKAVIVPATTVLTSVITTLGNVAVLTPEEPTKSTSSYTLYDYGAPDVKSSAVAQIIEAAVGDISDAAIPAPKLSVQSLLGKLEDIGDDDDPDTGVFVGADLSIVVMLDQSVPEIRVYYSEDASVTQTAMVALAEDAQVVLTEVEPTPASPRVFGE